MLGEVARLFLMLGIIGFGGPAAHIALMREEVVRRRRWVTEQQFLDLIGATNLIPGLNSTEMAASVSLATMCAVFLKIGAVLYGSGYVLLVFLRADFVERLGWLTDQQLLDAISIGQVTPGPVLTTATFIGYVLGGWPAAVLATLAIFLPAFVFVALSGPIIPRLRQWRWTAALLDGVNVAALGLMAAVTWQLARAALVDEPLRLGGAGAIALAVALALAAAVLLLRFRVNSAWLVAGGAAVGLVARFVLWA